MTHTTTNLTIAQLRSLANGNSSTPDPSTPYPIPSENTNPYLQAQPAQQTYTPQPEETYSHYEQYTPTPNIVDPRMAGVTRGDKWEAPNWLMHIHKYWHRYLGLCMVFIGIGAANFSSHVDISFGLSLFAGLLLGVQTWLALAFLRGKLQSTEGFFTLHKRSPVFKFGALLGLCYYLYSNGLPDFQMPETWDRQSLRPILWGVIVFTGEVYGGGKLLVFISKKFFDYDPEEEHMQMTDNHTFS